MAERQNSDGDKDTELTMCDVLEEEKELEDDANAVLGGSDDKNCSYDQGYVPRQALYACKTCTVDGFAGVCLACCYACHDGHEVVELYTKRNFRCDCGNSKFTNSKCALNPSKGAVNSGNKYNQNFKGLYCTCSRPYPDLEDSVPDEMIQCVMCEDWYHGRHLQVETLPDDYFEMICGKCMSDHPFLFPYLNKHNPVIDVVSIESGDSKNSTDTLITKPSDILDSNQETVTNGLNDPEDNKISKPEVPGPNQETVPNGLNDPAVDPRDGDNKISKPEVPGPNQETVPSELNDPEDDKKSIDTLISKPEVLGSNQETVCNGHLQNGESLQTCSLKKLGEGIKKNGAAFWPENWRKDLCQCSECMEVYKAAGCEYLLNLDDTIHAYEEKGKGGEESQYDKGLSALGQLDRVKQMEAIRAYTNMKGELKEYLQVFADNKRTVRECDIKEFFEKIGKKQKLNNGVPHFCR